MRHASLLTLFAAALLAYASPRCGLAGPPQPERALPAGDGPVRAAFSSTGKTLAVGAGQKLRLFDPATGKERFNLPGHVWPVRAIVFSPDSRILASGAGGFRDGKRGGEVKLWDVRTAKLRHELAWWEGDDVNAIAFAPDGAHVAAGGSKGIRVWSAATGKPVKELSLDAAVLALAYAPDGKTLAGGAFTQNVHLWDTGNWKESVLKGHASEVRSVAYSPDGKLLVTGGVGEARVWSADTGKHLRSLKCEGTVWSVAFSPGGEVATASGNPVADSRGEVRVWNPADGTEKGRWAWRGGAVVSVTFSPDGKTLACGRYDGGVVVWNPNRPERVEP